MILPAEMDGVPGISFDGIKPGETFTYQFDVRQNGTFWYHSHSRFQEQTGLYGAIVIDPIGTDPVSFDRDYVVLLSDWSDEKPERIYAKLKKQSDYYNFRQRTAGEMTGARSISCCGRLSPRSTMPADTSARTHSVRAYFVTAISVTLEAGRPHLAQTAAIRSRICR